MKKILVGLFIVIILSIGIVGYAQSDGQPNKIIDDSSNSITIQS